MLLCLGGNFKGTPSTHQDEETLVGKFLVLLDSGQHGQHQAAED